MKKILIVDDSEISRERVKVPLLEKGFQIVEAWNGLSGLDALEDNPDIDLILCDVQMPDMDGLTMCERVKRNEKTKDIPIFIVTTECTQRMKEEGKKIGVLAWVPKPVRIDVLLKVIDTVLNKEKK
jgi:two-component system, chemotaxis family, chemotaxis protein CheY